MSEPPTSEKSILDAARALEAEERTVFLDQTCGSDVVMRRRLESLLASATPETSPTLPLHSGAFGPSGTLVTDDDATVAAPTTVTLPAEEALGDTIGRYKLLEKIGEGGFGIVYVAEQTEPVKRRVALKIIKLGMDTRQIVARFEAERQALALMEHPNIAKVFDAGATETGRPYFVMELVRGTRITEHCDKNKLSTRKRLDLFMRVCRAIEHAHQKGIIHRDIKPSNILVTVNDGVPVPKVIDFGIAKATQGNLTDKTVFTHADQFVGTPAYMSPEQAGLGELDIDTRSDIYSLGVLLYELLTGETPLESKNLLARGIDEMRRLIRDWEPQLPSIRLHKQGAKDQTTVAKKHGTDAPKLIKMVRGDLDWVVMKCLEKDRSRRYDSAAELTAEIARFLADEAVLARPPSKVYRFKKMVRRNQLAFAAGGIVLASLIIGLVVTSWFVFKEKQERQIAEQASDVAERNLKIAVAERAKAEQALAQAEAAHEQSTADQKRSIAAESQAEGARREADESHHKAEVALQLAREDRDKTIAAELRASNALAQAQAARKQAEASDARATDALAKRDAADKAAAAETALRQQTETTLRQTSNALAKAEAEAKGNAARADQAQRTISNLLDAAIAPWSWSGADLSNAIAQAQSGLAAGTNDIHLYKSRLALGLLELRREHYAEAARWLGQVPAEVEQNPALAVQARAALALAQWHLQQTNEARDSLAQGRTIFDSKSPKAGSGDLGPDWTQWTLGQALLREAAGLISAVNTNPAITIAALPVTNGPAPVVLTVPNVATNTTAAAAK